jgi:hypothetical protein
MSACSAASRRGLLCDKRVIAAPDRVGVDCGGQYGLWCPANAISKYGLTLHPDKTRLTPFVRPRSGQNDRSGPGTFNFLGFTMYWCRTRRGGWRLGMKTRNARIQRAVVTFGEWCRRHRHLSLKDQHAALSRRPRGHYQYFGVNGNSRSLRQVQHSTERLWLKWLRRRSQRGNRLTWERFVAYLKAHPLPPSRISVQIWARAP